MTEKQTPWAIGIDLGGTKIKAAMVDIQGNILEEIKRPTNVEGGPEVVIRQMEEMAAEICLYHKDSKPIGLGIGVAGQITRGEGDVYFAPNLRWANVPLQSQLNEKLDFQTVVMNDVRAATYGEWKHGAGKNSDDIVCVFVGTGIGGGIIYDDDIVEGHSNSAGELGHTTIDLNGPKCTCNNYGCFEALAGGWAIGRDGKIMASKDPEAASALLEAANGSIDNITARQVIQMYQQGDPLCTEIIEDVKKALVAGLVSIVNGYNPECVIMGGGIMKGLINTIPELERRVRERALKGALEDFKIVPAELSNDAGVIGAAMYAIKNFNQ